MTTDPVRPLAALLDLSDLLEQMRRELGQGDLTYSQMAGWLLAHGVTPPAMPSEPFGMPGHKTLICPECRQGFAHRPGCPMSGLALLAASPVREPAPPSEPRRTLTRERVELLEAEIAEAIEPLVMPHAEQVVARKAVEIVAARMGNTQEARPEEDRALEGRTKNGNTTSPAASAESA